MEHTKASSLIDMANGAIKERLDYEMGRVIQNISDPNTKATAKRTITVKITLEPDEERQHVEVSATASSTLAALHPVKTALAVGQRPPAAGGGCTLELRRSDDQAPLHVPAGSRG